jgi:hypothetical protein
LEAIIKHVGIDIIAKNPELVTIIIAKKLCLSPSLISMGILDGFSRSQVLDIAKTQINRNNPQGFIHTLVHCSVDPVDELISSYKSAKPRYSMAKATLLEKAATHGDVQIFKEMVKGRQLSNLQNPLSSVLYHAARHHQTAIM